MRRSVLRAFLVAALVGSLGAGLAPLGQAAPRPGAGPAPTITRAGLDPSLVRGRGADVAFVEQEAENARVCGDVIGPSR